MPTRNAPHPARRGHVLLRRGAIIIASGVAGGGALAAVLHDDRAASGAARAADRTGTAARRPASAAGTDAARASWTALDVQRVRTAVERFEASAPGEIGVAIAPVHGKSVVTAGSLQEGRAWSAMKVPALLAFLNWRRKSAGSRDGRRSLSASERRAADRAIRRSDNLGIRLLYATMAARATDAGARGLLQGTLRAGGDLRTTITTELNPQTGLTAFGTTGWRLADAVSFYRGVARGRVAGGADTRYVLDLMRRPEHRTRWGISEAFARGVPLALKGGWGPEADRRWLVEQFAIVGSGRDAYVLGVMVRHRNRSASEADPAAYYAGRRLLARTAALVITALGPAVPSADVPDHPR
jgi:hypothetical protein